jgi:histidinol-phosphatase (PHP family)
LLQEFVALGGRFTLSDDSHGIEQVGLNYSTVLDRIKKAGIQQICHLTPVTGGTKPHDDRFPNVGWKSIPIDELEAHAFWTSAPPMPPSLR